MINGKGPFFFLALLTTSNSSFVYNIIIAKVFLGGILFTLYFFMPLSLLCKQTRYSPPGWTSKENSVSEAVHRSVKLSYCAPDVYFRCELHQIQALTAKTPYINTYSNFTYKCSIIPYCYNFIH